MPTASKLVGYDRLQDQADDLAAQRWERVAQLMNVVAYWRNLASEYRERHENTNVRKDIRKDLRKYRWRQLRYVRAVVEWSNRLNNQPDELAYLQRVELRGKYAAEYAAYYAWKLKEARQAARRASDFAEKLYNDAVRRAML